MANDVSNIKIEPADLTWGNPETTKVTAVADVASSLNSTFIVLTATDGTLFHAWIDVGSTGVDPAPANSTAIEIDITANDSAATIAALFVTGIGGVANFNSKIDPDNSAAFIIQNVGVGAASVVADGSAPTSFTILQLRIGSSFSIGFIDGDVDISASEDLFDVVAQQSGTQVVDKIRTGVTVENIAVAMKESSVAKLKVILEAGGASVTPGGGTEVTGMGESKRFTNISNETRQLIFHPVRNAAANLANDWVFWRAYPNLSGFNFSGETDQLITVDFQIIPDPLVLDAQNIFINGDHEQNLLK